jgi:hypothetical protein
MDEVENFFCQFPHPWVLKCQGWVVLPQNVEKKSKSLYPNLQYLQQIEGGLMRKEGASLPSKETGPIYLKA